MNGITRYLAPAAIIALSTLGATVVCADDNGFDRHRNSYVVTPLVSDQTGKAKVTDSNLKNAWGVTFSPGASPFWIADNATGLATLYDGDGTKVSVVVTIPCPTTPGQGSSCPTTAAPTGTVWNPTTSGFLVPGTTPPVPSHFIFATEDGTISAWASGSAATIAVNNATVPNATNGAVYKGLAVGVNVNGVIVNGGTSPTFVFLYATNFRAGTIDVFDAGFNQVTPGTPGKIDGSFTDPNIPAGFAPFGIQNINGDLFVTYAKQNAVKHDDVAGAGNGFVDVFDTNGFLLRRFASGRPLNSPWGVARASFAFGQFSGLILVGNFGNGEINVFDSRGRFIDELDDAKGKPLKIDGLWTLTLGGGAKSSSDTLYFTAGPNDEKDGLFGTITPVSDNDDND
jgi:uncharacterized protein (TIGR03118 family)